MNSRVSIKKLPTGVRGLDEVLGGGIPEFSFNLLAGGPGAGKTTMAHQIMFANAQEGRRSLYFTVLGEPAIKMLRYQQQFSFFEPSFVGEGVCYKHIEESLLEKGCSEVLEFITREVERVQPAIVMVDSFRSMSRPTLTMEGGDATMQYFLQRLALRLTAWNVTSFLLGEYHADSEDNPVFTVADGIVWLHQSIDRNSMVRKLQVTKVRGQGQIPGLHTFKITDDGLQVFPRLPKPRVRETMEPEHQISTGVEGLDELLCGGLPAGHSALVAGPSGSGKSMLAMQYILEGTRRDEAGIIAVFERHPSDYLKTTPFARDFQAAIDRGKLEILYLRPLDLSIDEAQYSLREAVLRLDAKRVVIDSLSGFELALAPTFREEFRESLYRLVGSLTGLGVTVLMTVELVDSYTDLRFSPHGISFLTDVIIMQRYVEIEGQIQRIIGVVKQRTGPHSKELHLYEIDETGLHVGRSLRFCHGLLTGLPTGYERAMAPRERES